MNSQWLDELGRALDQSIEHRQRKRAQAEEVRSRIAGALDRMPGFFAMADAGGVLSYLNPPGRALLGLERDEEADGMSLLECHALDARGQLMQVALPAAARDGVWCGDSVLLARDGSEIRTTLAIVALHDDDGQLTGYCVQERDMTGWVKADEALRAVQIETRRLEAQHLTARETERRRIAAGLHDGLGQSLSLLKLGIQEALRRLGTRVPRNAVEPLRQLVPKVAGALHELRRISTDLRPSILDDLGIVPTLSWFVRDFESASSKTRIETHISVSEQDVPERLKIAIFRILQEAVDNTLRHADADRIRVRLHNGGEVLAFSIDDDGKGFDPEALPGRDDARTGLGLQSMRQHAELSGGTYALTSAVGQGTRLCVCWPTNAAIDGYREQDKCAARGLQPETTADAAGAQQYSRKC